MSLPILALGLACSLVERTAVRVLTEEFEAEERTLTPLFDEVDAASTPMEIRLIEVASGMPQLTDIQFPPNQSTEFVALTRSGTAYVVQSESGATVPWFEVPVVTVSEQGLLGLAFHPEFATNGRFFINYTPAGVRPEISRVEEWSAPGGSLAAEAKPIRTVMEVAQPYQNHNAGQLLFGPDGMLYVPWGDGGLRDDPDANGQNPMTWLGSMLRVAVSQSTDASPYTIPPDNPFVDQPGARPETWAYGLRNPWRSTFLPDGRMVIADVGQDHHEEVSIASAGDNLGWNLREGKHCFPPESECAADDWVEPIHEYPRTHGISITGGHVYRGTKIEGLLGRYVFADFVTGRVWAMELPAGSSAAAHYALGKWPILPSTFGVDGDGELYVADYARGTVYRLDAPPAAAAPE